MFVAILRRIGIFSHSHGAGIALSSGISTG
jgi:hypothetical protein